MESHTTRPSLRVRMCACDTKAMAKQVRQPTDEEIKQLFRGVSIVIPSEEEARRIFTEAKKPLRIKLGIDPTTPDFHIGYLVIFRKLKILQNLGHQIVLLTGGFTARFGDPTDKADARALRKKDTKLSEAITAFQVQYERVLDPTTIEIRDNSEWYDTMSAETLLRLMSETTVAQMLERDMFQTRMKKGKPIGLHEPVYPLLQGYDSVELKADVTFVGTDQIFNENVARPLQERRGQTPQVILGLELIPGTDGNEKMSQSLGNAVLLNERPLEQYGKLMSVPDKAALQYAKMLTNLALSSLKEKFSQGGIVARDAKQEIAKAILMELHGVEAANEAAEQFARGARQETVPEIKIEKNTTIIEALLQAKLVASKSEARRLIEQKGVQENGTVVEDGNKEALKGSLLQVGKRKSVRILQ